MRSRSDVSAQTLSVLSALCEEPSQWRHLYRLTAAGLASASGALASASEALGSAARPAARAGARAARTGRNVVTPVVP